MSISGLRDPQVRASLNLAPKASGILPPDSLIWGASGTNLWVAEVPLATSLTTDVLIANISSTLTESPDTRLVQAIAQGGSLFFYVSKTTTAPTLISIAWVLFSPTT